MEDVSRSREVDISVACYSPLEQLHRCLACCTRFFLQRSGTHALRRWLVRRRGCGTGKQIRAHLPAHWRC
eukprot:6000884-Prymnesium_polylepis.1